ncbi:MAG TPA: hypothetical protein VLA20_07790, partial [Vicinamibacterales bacterium]|nr:hypothetical protein [Vicinamibacterales bacterium]
VDGVGTVTGVLAEGDCHRLVVEVPDSMQSCLVPKGSIAVDGVSLTIARLIGRTIEIQLVPFTIAHTAFHATRVGDTVNLEGDVLGKYVARLMEATVPPWAARDRVQGDS